MIARVRAILEQVAARYRPGSPQAIAIREAAEAVQDQMSREHLQQVLDYLRQKRNLEFDEAQRRALREMGLQP